ncbi:2Fe-2S iron-sulfur cluster-binding protein [Rheinheimera soli]|uniref:CDP-4-dehydro-6-deoxyglucose reductase n=1 Tax=Rheinheimera soli TaxID=443616 RepID=A0ABU1VU71_9GAMM|nr:2Fe-2S iron-sulfur cluster-binding protein [Rheinheimera soli]MDR7119267.1 CDP-4-dehydro-6-deoxyglucose reductase [Rheinheimera soli]
MNDLKIQTREAKQFVGNTTETILNSALKSGLVFEYSCKTGQCGVCKTKVISGRVTELQEQLALTEHDRMENKVLTCCCAPTSDLLIDAEDLAALHGIDIKTLPCRIKQLTRFSDELISVTLRLPPTAHFKFLEGQYIDIIGPKSIRRSYSIASTAEHSELVLYIKRFENGQMSDYWFNQAKDNDLLRIEGPKGTFFLRDSKQDLIFLATGTGIAPIISILSGLDNDPDFVQSGTISLYWGNRFPEDFFWTHSFKKLQVAVNYVLSRKEDSWPHQTGYVQNVALESGHDMARSAVYACGSNMMIKSAQESFLAAGLAENKFYSDAFVQSY